MTAVGIRNERPERAIGSGHQSWIDIYRGIAIILVVLGHSTAILNPFIYQFHVAAFFFISGWNAKPDRYRMPETVIKRAYTLILPLLMMVIIYAVGIKAIDLTGRLSLFYDLDYPTSIVFYISNFLTGGLVPDVLGTGWFLFVLFGCCVLARVLFLCAGRNKYVYLVFTIVLFVLGYLFVFQRGIAFSLNLIPVAHGYFGAGVFCGMLARERGQRETGKRSAVLYLILFLATTAIMAVIRKYLGWQGMMDLANREIINFWWSIPAVINGILWIYSLSKLISMIPVRAFTKVFSWFGKNSMGIMLLHFSIFRLVSCVLYAMHLIPRESCRNLVPVGPEAVYWPAYFAAGLLGAAILWALMGRVRVLRTLFGMNKEIPTKIMNSALYGKIANIGRGTCEAASSAKRIYAEKTIGGNRKRFFLHFAAFLAGVILVGAISYYSIRIYNNRQGAEAGVNEAGTVSQETVTEEIQHEEN